MKTYLGSIVISGKGTHISITPERWILNGEVHKWLRSEAMTSHKTKIVTDGTGDMIVVMFPNRITLLVMRHMRTKSQRRAGKVDFLGFYIVEDRGFSEGTHGLLGMVSQKIIALINMNFASKHSMYSNLYSRQPSIISSSISKSDPIHFVSIFLYFPVAGKCI